MSNHVHEAIKEKEAQVSKLRREIESLNAYLAQHEPSEKLSKPAKQAGQRRRRRTKAEMAAARANGSQNEFNLGTQSSEGA